jgi:predicted dehydrogenase
MGVLVCASSARSYQANEKLGVALVGVGGRGKWFVDTIPNKERVVAICDVNRQRAAGAFQKLPDVPKYEDFRKMLDEQGQQIDAVIVATPDNTHAVITMAAIKRNKHVYCEKPLTHDVGEARAVRDAAKEYGVATQMGNQGTASGQFRRAVELLRGGTIGEIKEVHVWKDSGGSNVPKPPEGTDRVPDFLNWDLWLGPAADRPFHPRWLHWHAWRDFGTGQLGNWGSHSANLAFKALKVDRLWYADPAANPRLRIEATTSGINRVSFPRYEVIRWHIPAREDFPAITFHWHNGRAPGSRDLIERTMGDVLDWGDKKEKKWRDHGGALIVGTKGKIHATEHNATFRLLPEGEFDDVQKTAPETLPRSNGHEREWLAACRGGPAAMSNFDYSGPLNEFLMLGNVATQSEGALEYDPLASKITNHEEADQVLRREYRQGWSL